MTTLGRACSGDIQCLTLHIRTATKKVKGVTPNTICCIFLTSHSHYILFLSLNPSYSTFYIHSTYDSYVTFITLYALYDSDKIKMYIFFLLAHRTCVIQFSPLFFKVIVWKQHFRVSRAVIGGRYNATYVVLHFTLYSGAALLRAPTKQMKLQKN